MLITNIIGVLDEIRGQDSARIRILYFKKDGKTIVNPSEIKEHFPPNGYVFAPQFFTQYSYEINSILEFKITPNPYPITNGDVFILDLRKDCKLAGIPLISVTQEILINKYSINQPLLRQIIDSTANSFYIKNTSFIYGPFRNLSGEVLPKVGMDVNRYESTQVKTFLIGDKELLFEIPTSEPVRVDCMTPTQLGEWLKSVLKGHQASFDFNLLKRLLDNLELQDLDKARLERICKYIDQISLTISDLKELSSTSESLAFRFTTYLESIKEELQEKMIEPFVQEKSELKREILQLSQKIQKLNKEEKLLTSKHEESLKQCEYIIKEKERLLSDLRIYAELNPSIATNSVFYSYDEQVYEDGKLFYNTLDDVISIFKKSITSKVELDRYVEMIVYQLKDYRLILTERIEPILQFARISNNCRLIIQQVEPNWLRFENLFNNGLSQIWKNAINDYSKLHFLILEDINLASIECYGKPLNDFSKKIRMSISGLGSDWPNNLWIFGLPIQLEEEHKLSLPLIRETFSHWGAIPKTPVPIEFTPSHSDFRLGLDVLLDHNKITAPLINEYF
jgi:hypothetical protein